MKAELFPFQKKALSQLRLMAGEAINGYQRTHSNQVVSFTAPTGAGKTIIMASLIEEIFFGGVDMRSSRRQSLFGCRILRSSMSSQRIKST